MFSVDFYWSLKQLRNPDADLRIQLFSCDNLALQHLLRIAKRYIDEDNVIYLKFQVIPIIGAL